jgi:hypothetical protein
LQHIHGYVSGARYLWIEFTSSADEEELLPAFTAAFPQKFKRRNRFDPSVYPEQNHPSLSDAAVERGQHLFIADD